ncbi:MAG: CtsR family transcriptional regulator [Oscillospiraceae bacterium]|nr:CtsR family transcriptional regulator [Candidatus Equicaccousia limihippi]
MRLSDLITETIMEMLDSSEENIAEIQRNDLASNLGCVPSQINYVLSSRFTPEHGFIVESRRGGGGYIRITRVRLDRSSAIMHIVNSVGESLDPLDARVLIENCISSQIIDQSVGKLLFACISSPVLREISPSSRDRYRAALIKQVLISLL